MKWTLAIIKYLVLLVGIFMIMMSFDVFEAANQTIIQKIGGFLVHASPGIILIFITIMLWKKEFYLGILLILVAIFLFVLFKFYRDINEKWLTIIIIEGPLLIGGLFLIYSKKQKK